MILRVLFFFLLGNVYLLADEFVTIADKIIIKKSARMLYLSKNGQIYQKYHISLGQVPIGAKEVEGDMKTPEGVYVLDWRQESPQYYKSLHISYPNPKDIAHAKELGANPGGMIMIHGTPPAWSLSPYGDWMNVFVDWTQGCIALSNDDIDEVWKQTIDGTIVIIIP